MFHFQEHYTVVFFSGLVLENFISWFITKVFNKSVLHCHCASRKEDDLQDMAWDIGKLRGMASINK